MTELHPALADMDPRLRPLNEQDFDLAGIDIVVNTTCTPTTAAATTSSPGKPIYVQRRELDDARSKDDYTIREWVEAPGVQYVPVDGELELLPQLDSSRRRATQTACRWSSSRPAGVRSSSAATWRCSSASSTSRPPKVAAVLALDWPGLARARARPWRLHHLRHHAGISWAPGRRRGRVRSGGGLDRGTPLEYVRGDQRDVH